MACAAGGASLGKLREGARGQVEMRCPLVGAPACWANGTAMRKGGDGRLGANSLVAQTVCALLCVRGLAGSSEGLRSVGDHLPRRTLSHRPLGRKRGLPLLDKPRVLSGWAIESSNHAVSISTALPVAAPGPQNLRNAVKEFPRSW